MEALWTSTSEAVEFLKSWGLIRPTVSTLVLLLAFFLFRYISVVSLRRWQAPSLEERRRWIIQVKNLSLVILAAGLFGIWATELRAFALSLVAVAAALAISTKEVIQCFLGGFYKASARPFEIGDRIELAGYRGEVINHSFFSTVLLEIGPSPGHQQLSGRQVILPNSLMLFHPVFNQSLQQEYVLQSLCIPVRDDEDWRRLEKILLESAAKECREFLEPARHSMARLERREGLDLPRVEPRVSFHYSADGAFKATLRFPTPASRVLRTEQAILRHILSAREV